MGKSTRWHVVDQTGDVLFTAESVEAGWSWEGKPRGWSLRRYAHWLADNQVNVDAGDVPVFARPVDAEPRS